LKNRIDIYAYAVLCVVPLLLGFGYSLLYSFGVIGLLSEGFTLQHWQRLWQSSGALSSLLYTLLLTVASLLLALAAALAVAWRSLQPGSGRLPAALFLPLLFPPLLAAFGWYYLLSPAGILSRLAARAGLIGGLEDFPRLVNDSWSVGIVVTHVFLVYPVFSLLFVAQSRKEQLPAMWALARNLGSSRRQFVGSIWLPLLLQKTRPVVVLYGLFLLGSYEVPLLLGRSAPQTVSLFITEKLSRFNLLDIPVGHAMAVVYSLLVLGIIALGSGKKTGSWL